MISNKIKVMLADDSSVIRRIITTILETEPQMEVVASVSNGELAVTMAKNKRPDVVILDVEMPVMDGLTALPFILKTSPETKVIMFSSLTAKGADTTIKAMALGAVECLVKPSGPDALKPDSEFRHTLINLIKSLVGDKKKSESSFARAGIGTTGLKRPHTAQSITKPGTEAFSLRNDVSAYKGKPDILAIGSSTGGPKALFKLLKDLNGLDVPIVITQHMPATFTKILADHITQQTGIKTYEGENGMIVEKGKAYVAPGGEHMIFNKTAGGLTVKLDNGPEENFCKPSVDPMMRSLVDIYGNKVLCTILTGMGQDGLAGAKYLIDRGGRVIAQDKETSVVWGMPGAVAMAGICSSVLPIQEIAPWIKRACS